MRFRITVRADNAELRGYTDQESVEALNEFAQNMAPIGVVVASATEDSYDPFAIDAPEDPPTIEKSREAVHRIASESTTADEFMGRMIELHFMQASVIRGERGQKEQALVDLQARELHHFETEQMLERIKALHTPVAVQYENYSLCKECLTQTWPCPTMRAMGASDE
jgi:hypothetical protein